MIELDDQQKAAQAWFRSLRDSIWAMLEQLEDESTLPGDAGRFEKRVWDRSDHSGGDGGGGALHVHRPRTAAQVTRGAPVRDVHGVAAAGGAGFAPVPSAARTCSSIIGSRISSVRIANPVA